MAEKEGPMMKVWIASIFSPHVRCMPIGVETRVKESLGSDSVHSLT